MSRPAAVSSRALYWRLLSCVAPYWRVFALSIAAMVVVAASEPAFPALMKPLLDGNFVDKDPTLMRWLPAGIIVIFLVRGVASYVSGYCVALVANRLVLDLRQRMFQKLVRLPAATIDDHSSGRLISRFTFDVMQLTGAGTSVVTVLIKDSLAILGLLLWLLYLNWRLTLITLALAPVIALTIRTFSGRLRSSSRAGQRAMGDVNQVLEETVSAHRVVKIFGGQGYELRRFGETTQQVFRFNMKQAAAAAANVPLVQAIAAIGLAAIVYLATQQAVQDQTTVGGFVSFLVAMLMLLAPLKRLTGVTETIQRGLAAAESVFDMIDMAEEPDHGSVELGRARGELRFERLSFHYPQAPRPALSDIDLDVGVGEKVALVGASGAGKSTFAALIPRLYHPSSGRLYLDGVDLEQLTLASLRANIALVSQEVVLFNDSVAANIAYGRLADTPLADIEAAASAAHALDFIRELPQGMLTMIGENGVKLSGGQRQRLAIARALLKDAPVLILDEATSALDAESERQVQLALERLMQNRTTIIIAHRLSTIERADRIVVLEQGRIGEIGSHATLLARGGKYAQLYHTQYAIEH